MKHRTQAGLLAAAWIAGTCAMARAQGYDPARTKARLEQGLQRRVVEIEKRFAEEHAFRTKMKDERIAFERKLVVERKAFLDAVQRMKPEDRPRALDAFYQQLKEKRAQFRAEQRAEIKKFWQARAGQRAPQAPGPQ